MNTHSALTLPSMGLRHALGVKPRARHRWAHEAVRANLDDLLWEFFSGPSKIENLILEEPMRRRIERGIALYF